MTKAAKMMTTAAAAADDDDDDDDDVTVGLRACSVPRCFYAVVSIRTFTPTYTTLLLLCKEIYSDYYSGHAKPSLTTTTTTTTMFRTMSLATGGSLARASPESPR